MLSFIQTPAIVSQYPFDVPAVRIPESISFDAQFIGVDQLPCDFPGQSRCIFLVARRIFVSLMK
jgi:hypothetical protein